MYLYPLNFFGKILILIILVSPLLAESKTDRTIPCLTQLSENFTEGHTLNTTEVSTPESIKKGHIFNINNELAIVPLDFLFYRYFRDSPEAEDKMIKELLDTLKPWLGGGYFIITQTESFYYERTGDGTPYWQGPHFFEIDYPDYYDNDLTFAIDFIKLRSGMEKRGTTVSSIYVEDDTYHPILILNAESSDVLYNEPLSGPAYEPEYGELTHLLNGARIQKKEIRKEYTHNFHPNAHNDPTLLSKLGWSFTSPFIAVSALLFEVTGIAMTTRVLLYGASAVDYFSQDRDEFYIEVDELPIVSRDYFSYLCKEALTKAAQTESIQGWVTIDP
jgi:hypothetical protein